MPRASKTEKADTPAKPTKPAKAPAKHQKPASTVKSSKNDEPAARSSTVKVATSLFLIHASNLSGPVPSYRPNSEPRSESQAQSLSLRAPQTPTPYSQATTSLTRYSLLAHVDVLVGHRWQVFGQDIEYLAQKSS